jgi:hypothetical protein
LIKTYKDRIKRPLRRITTAPIKANEMVKIFNSVLRIIPANSNDLLPIKAPDIPSAISFTISANEPFFIKIDTKPPVVKPSKIENMNIIKI